MAINNDNLYIKLENYTNVKEGIICEVKIYNSVIDREKEKNELPKIQQFF